VDRLKPVAENLWIVDGGPIRAFGLEMPVRMTLIRLRDGGLWVHSPTPYCPMLREQIEPLGPVRHLVAPSFAHWRFLQDWSVAYPRATTWGVPGLRDRAQVRRSGVRIDRELSYEAPPEWATDMAQAMIRGGGGFNEAAFFHLGSRTLLLTDLVQNLALETLPPLTRSLAWLVGAAEPGGTPLHLRALVLLNRREARVAAARVLAWKPERVIFAHGAWFERDAAQRLRASLSWLLR
jgi:hypothetical protein